MKWVGESVSIKWTESETIAVEGKEKDMHTSPLLFLQ